MTVIDPGHTYELGVLDGTDREILRFVKREGPNYPGNVGVQCGTTLQEVLRACIDRVKYLDNQIPCMENKRVIIHLGLAIDMLEQRAAHRHNRRAPEDSVGGTTCPLCLHVGCIGNCRAKREESAA
jgi:hypothetical protein